MKNFKMANKKYNSLHIFLRELVDKQISIHYTNNYIYRIIYLWNMNTACVIRCENKHLQRLHYKIKWEDIGSFAINKNKRFNRRIYEQLEGKVG